MHTEYTRLQKRWHLKAKTVNDETQCLYGYKCTKFICMIIICYSRATVAVMPTLPLLAGDLRFFASSPALPLFTSTINMEYLVKDWTLITAFLFLLNHKEMLKLRWNGESPPPHPTEGLYIALISQPSEALRCCWHGSAGCPWRFLDVSRFLNSVGWHVCGWWPKLVALGEWWKLSKQVGQQGPIWVT